MMKKKVSTTKKSRVSDKIVDGLEDLAGQLEKSTNKMESGIDSIEYLDQQDKLRKFNLK